MTDTPWTHLPVLDRAFLTEQTFGESALAREVLSMFEQQCAALEPVIADSSAPEQQSVAVHTLKGAAAAIGARRLAEYLSRYDADRISGEAIGELLEIVAATRSAAARACSELA